MANPQPTDAHLRVAHSINEAIMLRDFTKRQRKILDLILRLSWGCGKKGAIIPRQKDFGAVGVGESHIKVELSWLAASEIIYIGEQSYSFNKNFEDWQSSRIKPFSPERLTELVSLNLNGSKPKLTKTVSQNLPKQEELSYQNSKFPKANSATPKESIKESIKKDTTTREQTFNEYVIQLKNEFRGIDFDSELRKFELYWQEGNRKLKRPKLALLNWMQKAHEYKQGGGVRDERARTNRGIPGNRPAGAFADLEN